MQLTIIGPVGGTIEDVTYNDQPLLTPAVVDLQGRPVLSIGTQLEPGETSDYKWTMLTGEGQTGTTTVDVTPGVLPETYGSQAAGTC